NRFLFISPSFNQGPDSNLRWRKFSVAGHDEQACVGLAGERIGSGQSSVGHHHKTDVRAIREAPKLQRSR
ncbi:hypothetical protein, partial [Mesorhizobium sp. M0496]|uniref:hypothetical protein n=1 Tax=Mesorhizobium sp. M0496 TaxID=2956952 RepID=UPI003337A066